MWYLAFNLYDLTFKAPLVIKTSKQFVMQTLWTTVNILQYYWSACIDTIM